MDILRTDFESLISKINKKNFQTQESNNSKIVN